MYGSILKGFLDRERQNEAGGVGRSQIDCQHTDLKKKKKKKKQINPSISN